MRTYSCVKAVSVVFVVAPSPKSQNELLIVPVERSVKETLSGQSPVVGKAEKSATGGMAAEPISRFVALPALSVVKTAQFVNVPTLVGAKRRTTLVVPNPAGENGLPETTVNGPPSVFRLAVPFDNPASP